MNIDTALLIPILLALLDACLVAIVMELRGQLERTEQDNDYAWRLLADADMQLLAARRKLREREQGALGAR